MSGLRVRGWCLPRRGCRADECQDAWAADEAAGRVAVSDGATESAFAGPWARRLVEQFARHGGGDWPALLAGARPRWLDGVDLPAPLPWFVEAGLARGAYATFLGVTVQDDVADVVAVGDSCLFHVRGDELLCSFPLDDPAHFGSSPPLVGSRAPPDELASCRLHLRPGDRLWLATDALACWFLVEARAGDRPWRRLDGWLARDGDEEWAAWVGGLRDARRLRNDDTTMVAVTWHP